MDRSFVVCALNAEQAPENGLNVVTMTVIEAGLGFSQMSAGLNRWWSDFMTILFEGRQ